MSPIIEISANADRVLKTISVCVTYRRPELTTFDISRIARVSQCTVRRHIRGLQALKLIEFKRRAPGLPYVFDVTAKGKVYLTGQSDELRIS